VRTGLRELEGLYRMEFVRFVRVATAITRDADAAADVVQEAFARAIKSHGKFRGEGPLEAWLWRIVVNEARRRGAPPATVVERAGEPVANGTPAEGAAVRALVAALPERQRLAVFLRYYADLDYGTIAQVLGVETGTVSATLAAAHRSLRQALEGVRS
jgi:RNA polymerase sigma-70 factor, ECF subfamily